MTSWKVEILDYGKWISNGLRFATFEEAREYGVNLAGKWSGATHWRVVDSEDPVNQIPVMHQ